ncbi:hypothetical protein KK062_28305 [Fulvivirgaceae bacterium PWU5]|uniref:Uncharacterized protein n=1 Tax=Dawidia cretensis TaxID=2782350 RepID=A0AAP2E5F1_9BACT|nr:hypothetical protein [Dawidia cretensis]MBT1712177.1 hypothetical protein [Dawidia cretensis]
MKTVCIIVGYILALTTTCAQSISLTDFLIFPRLDSTHWYHDQKRINSNYDGAGACETCFTTTEDSVRNTYCIQTAFGHARLDTSFNNASSERLQGKWTAVKAGAFEVLDSTSDSMDRFVRNIRVLDDQKAPAGFIEFTGNKVHVDLTTTHGRQRDRGRYMIRNKQFMLARKFIGRACSPTIIGITPNGLLVMDVHAYGMRIKMDKYFVFTSRITRLILQREGLQTVSSVP